METLNSKIVTKKQRPTRIIQFGEGNFLRAFIDWFIQVLDDETDFNGGVAVVQPLATGRVKDLEAQDGLYTLLLEGIDNGELKRSIQVIDVLNQFINPYTEYADYLSLAENPDIKLVISNTTEAGIVYDPKDTNYDDCPASFPGKLLALLKRRYDYFMGDKDAGLYILACELIDY
ncbi:MAG: tagaturonate reductase, partial [Erysipelotrichaceae bacterium]|nr:tagaturonate reductase [Erysipelotrichaceae bacterium]